MRRTQPGKKNATLPPQPCASEQELSLPTCRALISDYLRRIASPSAASSKLECRGGGVAPGARARWSVVGSAHRASSNSSSRADLMAGSFTRGMSSCRTACLLREGPGPATAPTQRCDAGDLKHVQPNYTCRMDRSSVTARTNLHENELFFGHR